MEEVRQAEPGRRIQVCALKGNRLCVSSQGFTRDKLFDTQ